MTSELPNAPAAERNKVPIYEALAQSIPDKGTLLEIASGYGQHTVYFAERTPSWTFIPSDVSRENVVVIAARLSASGLNNVRPPQILDVREAAWNVPTLDAVLNVNMIHISPWSAAEGLFRGAARALNDSGLLMTYGPYRIGGEHTAPSNAEFDTRLRAMDPRFGVRDLESVEALAQKHGFTRIDIRPMPANNFFVCFRRIRSREPGTEA
ncbi:MAG: DUF938 domain-containing protein [Myxococcota bacterium]